jgi:hypothetical protein
MAKEVADAMKDVIADAKAAEKARKAAEAARKAHPPKKPPTMGPGATEGPKGPVRPGYEAGDWPGKGTITHVPADAREAARIAEGARMRAMGQDVARGIFPTGAAGFNAARRGIVIIHTGDTNTIHADGVHPKKVSQALNKHSHQTRNKRR